MTLDDLKKLLEELSERFEKAEAKTATGILVWINYCNVFRRGIGLFVSQRF